MCVVLFGVCRGVLSGAGIGGVQFEGAVHGAAHAAHVERLLDVDFERGQARIILLQVPAGEQHGGQAAVSLLEALCQLVTGQIGYAQIYHDEIVLAGLEALQRFFGAEEGVDLMTLLAQGIGQDQAGDRLVLDQ